MSYLFHTAPLWSKWLVSNQRPPDPKSGALPTELHLVVLVGFPLRLSYANITFKKRSFQRAFSFSSEPRHTVSHCQGATLLLVGQGGLEPPTALSTWFTVRGDTNYTVLTHLLFLHEWLTQTIHHVHTTIHLILCTSLITIYIILYNYLLHK